MPEAVNALQAARVADGKPVDAPDPPTQARIFSDFAEAVASAATPEKRTALVHAAAKQFDPDAGTMPVRKYWFNEVRGCDSIAPGPCTAPERTAIEPSVTMTSR